ncbi:tRNA dihydrouridine synthase [Leptotrichia sp. oral taxon 847]|uniref:tRNA dihydrouridine synthase n=1 Tax=Leptotrichia sp. oral taxon 847 TaxID=1785996 RepID=UPI00076802D3|nr:tRNA-dihydrouridine synthase family protein [Leptotrichia sp. oral taxon 847]AMD94539.1 dihydrouridine synthase [Leptotrichia sp. oral taxon 847]
MKIYIAPMSGITDYAFRKILEKFNPDFLFTEMVNANLLNRENDATINELLKCDDKEKTGTQIFGGDKNELLMGILKLEEIGFKKININMGCPQPKIIKNGAGSALLENYNLMDELFSELLPKLNSGTKISIKIRTGYKNFNNPEIFLNLANKYNLDFICVHGRTQKQFYSGSADWEITSNLSKLLRNTKFFGNGDLFEPEVIKNRVEKCNLDGIMLSRGVIGNPWLIAQAREFLQTGEIKTVKTFDNTKEIVLEHLENIFENKGDIKAVLEINKFLKPYFLKFQNEVYDFKNKIGKIIIEKDFIKKQNLIKRL